MVSGYQHVLKLLMRLVLCCTHQVNFTGSNCMHSLHPRSQCEYLHPLLLHHSAIPHPMHFCSPSLLIFPSCTDQQNSFISVACSFVAYPIVFRYDVTITLHLSECSLICHGISGCLDTFPGMKLLISYEISRTSFDAFHTFAFPLYKTANVA